MQNNFRPGGEPRLRHRHKLLALTALALLLHGCGSSHPTDGSSGSDYSPNAASGGASGAPVTDSKGCTQYGDPPRPLAPASLDGTFNNFLTALTNVCTFNGGTMLDDYTDNSGSQRRACMIVPKNASGPLPMLVFVHPTLVGEDAIVLTDLLPLVDSANLSGDSSKPGFVLLIPLGRNIEQFLPFPLNSGVGWDHWYRNTDRNSPYLNADFGTIDHYIAEVKAKGVVDSSRVYVTGWSEGADFGTFYGLNTPGVAATGVFSTVSPYDDSADPCPGPAFATNNTRPYYLMVRECDIGGACDGAQTFLGQLRSGVMAPSLVQGVILNSNTQPVQSCNETCAPGTVGSDLLGQLEHIQWPIAWNDNLLQFMEQNPEP
jgi:hypothetical protein